MILLHWLASRRVVTVLISSGNDIPFFEILLALFFVFIRSAMYLLLPGIILSRLVMILIEIIPNKKINKINQGYP
jgi:hypothetical protein